MPFEKVVIRYPTWLVVFTLVFAAVWLGGVGTGLVLAITNGSGGSAIPLVLMFCWGLGIFSTMMRTKVVAEGDELRVLNLVREQRISRSEIDRFVEHDVMGVKFAKAISVLTHDGQLMDLRATMAPLSRQKRADDLDQLQKWHAATS